MSTQPQPVSESIEVLETRIARHVTACDGNMSLWMFCACPCRGLDRTVGVAVVRCHACGAVLVTVGDPDRVCEHYGDLCSHGRVPPGWVGLDYDAGLGGLPSVRPLIDD